MVDTFVGAVFMLAVIKLILALCGHRVTWRLVFLLALLIALVL